MQIIDLKQRQIPADKSKWGKSYHQFQDLINELSKKELPDSIIDSINTAIDKVNSYPDTGNKLIPEINKQQTSILKLLEKELKIVPKSHYRNLWMALGMASFGIPMGAAFGLILENMAFLGVGLPIGLAVGIAIGTGIDKKAFEEGRQLNIEI